jgi:phage terminase large subunit-like protein
VLLQSPTATPLPPTHGAAMADWMETELVHGEGDLEGEPFRLAPHLLRAIYRWGEYDPETGLYLASKGLIGWPKGSAKTEFEAALGLEHLEGPSPTHGTPVVTVAAVDGDQADELVRVAGMMVPEGSALRDRLRIDNGRIVQRAGAGRMLATSSALGKNDGKKTSLLLADELHEWDAHGAAGAKRHGILERSVNKRRMGRQLNVSTAGWSLETLLGAMYRYGVAVTAGELVDPGYLFEWIEASPHWDLDVAHQLEAAITEANPMVELIPELLDRLVRSYHEHKARGEVNDFLRYHLNRWVGVLEDAWMDMVAWADRAEPGPLPGAGADIILGFDGSYNGDSTALVGATIAPRPHLFVVGAWERNYHDRTWTTPVLSVEQTIEQACSYWNVRELAADPAKWLSSLARLKSRGVPFEDFPQSPHRMAPACQHLYEAVTRQMVTHDDDGRLRAHMANARRNVSEFGVRIVKEHERSKRRIDLAVAAVMAHSRALWWQRELNLTPAAAEPTIRYL